MFKLLKGREAVSRIQDIFRLNFKKNWYGILVLFILIPLTADPETIIMEETADFAYGETPIYWARFKDSRRRWGIEILDEELRAVVSVALNLPFLNKIIDVTTVVNGSAKKYGLTMNFYEVEWDVSVGNNEDKDQNIIQVSGYYQNKNLGIGAGDVRINGEDDIRGCAWIEIRELLVCVGASTERNYSGVVGFPSINGLGIRNLSILEPESNFYMNQLILAENSNMSPISFWGINAGIVDIVGEKDVVIDARRYLPEVQSPLHDRGRIALEIKYTQPNKDIKIIDGKIAFNPRKNGNYMEVGYESKEVSGNRSTTWELGGGFNFWGFDVNTEVNYTPTTKGKSARIQVTKSYEF